MSKIFIGLVTLSLIALGSTAFTDKTVAQESATVVSNTVPTPLPVAESKVASDEVHPPDSEQLPGPVIDPNYVPGQERNDPRILPPAPEFVPLDPSPFIGDASTMFDVGMGHVCGWDTTALGGWNWEACGSQLYSYINAHCSANDGVVHPIRCQEWVDGTLPISY